MTWNYRLIQYESHVELVEMYYDNHGVIEGWTESLFVANDLEDMILTLGLMQEDLRTKPVIQASDLPIPPEAADEQVPQ